MNPENFELPKDESPGSEGMEEHPGSVGDAIEIPGAIESDSETADAELSGLQEFQFSGKFTSDAEKFLRDTNREAFLDTLTTLDPVQQKEALTTKLQDILEHQRLFLDESSDLSRRLQILSDVKREPNSARYTFHVLVREAEIQVIQTLLAELESESSSN